MRRYPHAQLITSGEAVGLPAGQMGNSEVGHMNMGAGRVVYQDLTRIDKSIRDGELFASPVLAAAMDRCVDGQHALHFIGLLSDGGVHSSQQHLHALHRAGGARARAAGLRPRDHRRPRHLAAPAASRYLGQLAGRSSTRPGPAGSPSICGRYYAMDRDKRWERIKLGYDAIVDGVAEQTTQHRRLRRCRRPTKPA